MQLNNDICYQALSARDTRFDGAFFVGVKSTRIYCRTVCTAKTPLKMNCSFYRSAAAAEKAGFRPCLRCRPELAPGNAPVDSSGRLAFLALERMEETALTDQTVDEWAFAVGISARHLRRVVESEYGVSPLELATTQRLLFAKRLLTDTDLPVTEIAFASGFSSLRRFNALFKERYKLKPSELRKNRCSSGSLDSLVCELSFRPPFDWESLLHFLSPRLFAGAEEICDGFYQRTVSIGKQRGWIKVGPAGKRNALRLEVSSSLAPSLSQIISRVKHLFDLRAEPQNIEKHLVGLPLVHSGLRVPGAFDGFELACRAILGQQVSVKAADTLARRFCQRFGEVADHTIGGLSFYTPTPERIAGAKKDEIIKLGILPRRAESIIALAQAVVAGAICLEPGVDPEETMRCLEQVPGIGVWTSQYITMRALSWPDAFPHTDLGIQKAMGERDARKVLEQAESWRPWRAYAAMHLWKTLEKNI